LNGNGSQSSFVPFEQLLSSQLSEDTASKKRVMFLYIKLLKSVIVMFVHRR